jgi:hypothetical protein
MVNEILTGGRDAGHALLTAVRHALCGKPGHADKRRNEEILAPETWS